MGSGWRLPSRRMFQPKSGTPARLRKATARQASGGPTFHGIVTAEDLPVARVVVDDVLGQDFIGVQRLEVPRHALGGIHGGFTRAAQFRRQSLLRQNRPRRPRVQTAPKLSL